MTSEFEQDLREAATSVTLTLDPADEEALKHLDKVRRWFGLQPPPHEPGTYLLVLHHGDAAPTWVTVPGTALVIGRAPDAGLRLDSKHVSKQHCALEVQGSDWCVRDLASTNGVGVNGRKRDLAWLASGDVLQIGDFRLFFLQVRDPGPC
jgi:hypothetical protein